ncbi:hypothetical protein [Streptomyces bluensis]|uniref:hypothetical protein n=1 Tax=Streptomyces bluensis TaxID=33897 RepID=UPI0016786DA9|nr:hypothetical protein [Streptomyces bluensis]GGZ70884.1 hypothetical protein GCM10010344_42020 [Streptomyces bluensis]
MSQKPQGYHLTELPAEPSAVPGCAKCLSLVNARQNARSTGDYSAVSDCNVGLREHHAEAH